MARAARKAEPDARAPDPQELADAAHRFAAHLSRMPTLPPSWPYDIPPDGTQPCGACGGRAWSAAASGWCCDTCHPPTPKQATRARRVAFEDHTP